MFSFPLDKTQISGRPRQDSLSTLAMPCSLDVHKVCFHMQPALITQSLSRRIWQGRYLGEFSSSSTVCSVQLPSQLAAAFGGTGEHPGEIPLNAAASAGTQRAPSNSSEHSASPKDKPPLPFPIMILNLCQRHLLKDSHLKGFS